MQKKLLAAAMAAVFVAPAAFAQGSNVTIYGLLQPSIDVIDSGDNSGTSVQHNTSRIGFSGSEDLGNGLKAIFQIESVVQLNLQGDASTGVDSFFASRDSWVGLSGAFGSFTLGNHQTASVRGTAYLDPFADSIADYNDIIGLVRRGGANAGFDNRLNNSVYYTSPKFGAFQVLASYALAANNDIDDDADDDNVYSIAIGYSDGPLNVTVAYEHQGSATAADDKKGFKIGGSYAFGPTTVYALWDRIDQGDISPGVEVGERDAYYLGVKHTIGKIDLLARYIHAEETDQDDGDDGADNWALGAAYNFSKRTSLWALYSSTNNDDNGQYGLNKTTYLPDNPGDDVSGFSVRLRHSF